MEKDVLLDNPMVSHVVFYTRKIPVPNDLTSDIDVLRLKIKKNITIGGFFYRNDVNLPTILLFHGNGEIALDYRYFAHMFFNCNVNLAVVDFRGYGFSTGEPYYTSLITDAIPIYQKFKEWMVQKGLNEVLFVQGRSLGSVCAAEIGSIDPENLKGIIFESGFASIYNMMTRLFRIESPILTPDYVQRYSNDTRVKMVRKPVLIIHGTKDWIIPSTESELLYENIPNNIDKKLIMINGAGHNDILSRENEYFTPLAEFISKNK